MIFQEIVKSARLGRLKNVVVCGETSEPSTVKVKPSTSGTWKDARMLKGNRFESDLDIITGANQINVEAKDTSNNTSNYTYGLNLTAAAAASPTYDNDGNAESYPVPYASSGTSYFEWDAENRLGLVENSSLTPYPTDYSYDTQGRMIGRMDAVTGGWTYYVYDGWNRIAEYDSGLSLLRAYCWGLDLSGSLQGGGGVGGLLAVCHENEGGDPVFYPTYDGNGNVSEYLDNSGSNVAHFEYDPFGNTVVNTDTSGKFRYRFSTKPQDSITGLYYFGYRFYDPLTGRWPSRDPIEEGGGRNLYGFTSNNGISEIDRLGLIPVNEPEYNEHPPVCHLEFTSPGGSVAVGQAFIDFTVKFRNQESKKCCLEAYASYAEGPYAIVNDALAIRQGFSPTQVELHELDHLSAVTSRWKSLMEDIRQEQKCYDSEEEADEAAATITQTYGLL